MKKVKHILIIVGVLVMLFGNTFLYAQASIPTTQNESETSQIFDPIPTKQKPVVQVVDFNVKGLVLKKGVYSEEVLRLNRFLKKKGYVNIADTYCFDSKTKDAIIKFQKENGLTADGIVGANTYTAINNDMKKNNIIVPEITMELTGTFPKETWLMINKTSNTLYQMRDNTVVRKYHVATGATASLTPEGKFTLILFLKNPAWGGGGYASPIPGGVKKNPLGPRWMGLSIKGGGSYGIHGNSNFSSIGTNASHGCIRMYNDEVKILYDLVKKGTPVWIGNTSKLKSYGVSFL